MNEAYRLLALLAQVLLTREADPAFWLTNDQVDEIASLHTLMVERSEASTHYQNSTRGIAKLEKYHADHSR